MSRQVLNIELRPAAGAYEMRASLRSDAWWSWRSTRWYPITDHAHVIELEWHAASSGKARDGGLAWWVDGVLREIVTGVNNDAQRIDRAQLGAVSGIDSGTSGSYYFDAFESRRDGYIGLGEP